MGEKHEKIKKNQIETSKLYSEKNPSEVTEIFWIYAVNNNLSYPVNTPRSGKWLIFVPKIYIDQVWKTIKSSIERGELGNSAKISTAKPNPNAKDPGKGVICVYTYDSDDLTDVRRIRQRLRELGITGKIPYKEDRATLEGKYEVRGHRRISKYFE